MGENLEGRITYTEDGNVSVHIMAPGRLNLASGDISQGTTEEWAAAARGYFGYCGTFEVDEERATVTHVVALSLVHRLRRKVHLPSEMNRCTASKLVGRPFQTDESSVWVGPLVPNWIGEQQVRHVELTGDRWS